MKVRTLFLPASAGEDFFGGHPEFGIGCPGDIQELRHEPYSITLDG